jgi:hypothetical protein
MTITPVDGEFVAKKKDNYDFIDAQSRAVALPGKAGLVIRIRRIGAENSPAKMETHLDPS